MAERILLLSVPHSARLSSIRASAATLCSYIEGLTGSGATATVKTRSPCATARLRVGVRPAKRVIMGRLRLDLGSLALTKVFCDDWEIIVPRSRIDRFLQDKAHKLGTTNLDSGFARQFQRIGKILQ